MHYDLLTRWPSAAALAAEIGENANTVMSWRRRGVPPRVWPKLVAAAEARGWTDVSLKTLADAYYKRHDNTTPASSPQKVNVNPNGALDAGAES